MLSDKHLRLHSWDFNHIKVWKSHQKETVKCLDVVFDWWFLCLYCFFVRARWKVYFSILFTYQWRSIFVTIRCLGLLSLDEVWNLQPKILLIMLLFNWNHQKLTKQCCRTDLKKLVVYYLFSFSDGCIFFCQAYFGFGIQSEKHEDKHELQSTEKKMAEEDNINNYLMVLITWSRLHKMI